MKGPTTQQRFIIYALIICLGYFFTPLVGFVAIAVLEFFALVDPSNSKSDEKL